MEGDGSQLPLTIQADLLSLSRASLYYRPRGPPPAEVALKHRIDALYTRYPFNGSRRIAAQLRREGLTSNRKEVQRLWRLLRTSALKPAAIGSAEVQHRTVHSAGA